MARRAASADFEPQRAYAAGLPAATEDIKWGADLVYSVGAKMFCVFLLRDGLAASCSFKVDDDRFLELTSVPGVVPAPYLARAKWVHVQTDHGLAVNDLNALIQRSHALVCGKLTRRLQQQLGLVP
jgi:predicted DNA-binding protein (MmcQ/YjbR family)